jgi:hypothetical protein
MFKRAITQALISAPPLVAEVSHPGKPFFRWASLQTTPAACL